MKSQLNRYRETGYPVPRRELGDIRCRAHEFLRWTTRRFPRAAAGVPVVEVIEYLGSEVDKGYPDFEIRDVIPGYVAQFKPDEHLFVIERDVWDAATDGEGEARILLAHELGHYVLEHPANAFGRQFFNDIVVKEEDSESQANLFADEYLMDCRQITPAMTAREIALSFGVDEGAALRRLDNLKREKYWKAN